MIEPTSKSFQEFWVVGEAGCRCMTVERAGRLKCCMTSTREGMNEGAHGSTSVKQRMRVWSWCMPLDERREIPFSVVVTLALNLTNCPGVSPAMKFSNELRIDLLSTICTCKTERIRSMCSPAFT